MVRKSMKRLRKDVFGKRRYALNAGRYVARSAQPFEAARKGKGKSRMQLHLHS